MQLPNSGARPRIYFVYSRVNPARILVLVLVALAGLVAWVAMFAGFMLAILLARKLLELPEAVSALGVTISLIAATVSALLWSAVVADALNAYCLRIFHRYRYRRLQRISQHPDGLRRLPHRMIEMTLFAGFRAKSKRLGVFVQCPTNMVACCIRRPRTQPRSIRIGISTIPFEPLDLQSDYVDAVRFTQMLSSESPALRRHQEEAESAPVSLRDRIKQFACDGSGIVGAIVLPLMLYRSFANSQISVAVVVAALMVMPVVIVLFFRNERRRWWLVPGGVIMSQRKRWSSSQKISFVTRQQTPMFLTESAFDRRNATTIAYVLSSRGPTQLKALPQVAGIILAGWRSNAPTPTREEVLAFVGPDAVYDE